MITTDGRRMKIAAIGPQGQYKAYILKNTTEPAAYVEDKGQYKTFVFKGNAAPGTGAENGGTVALNNKGYAYAAGQEQGSTAERHEYVKIAVHSEVEGQISEQEMLARRKQERVEEVRHEIRQIRLAQHTKITMDQAIQTALHDSPGMVTEARLIGEEDNPTYIVVILQQNGTKDTIIKLIINAVDGSIVTSDKWGQER